MNNIDNWKLYYEMVTERCMQLVESGIWNGIDRNRYQSWLNNFQTQEQKTLAALVLDSLIFRSEDHVISMLEDILSKGLHNLWRINHDPLYGPNNPLQMLRERHGNYKVRIVAAKSLSDDNNVSADYINHLLFNKLNIRKEYECHPNDIKNKVHEGIDCFIIIDDCSLSGTQIDDFLRKVDYPNITGARFYLAVCTIHDDALSCLLSNHSSIPVVYAEHLDNSNCFFQDLPLAELGLSSNEEAIEKYKQIIKELGILTHEKLGFNNMALTYAFAHCTPNDSLSILSFNSSNFHNLTNSR